MKNEIANPTFFSQRRAAVVTGASLLLMTVLAGVVMGLVFNPVFGADQNSAITLLLTGEITLATGVIGWVFIFLLDVLVSISLFSYYRSKNTSRSVWMAVFRLVYSAILAVGICFLVRAWIQAGNGDAGAIKSISTFKAIWQNGLIVFGIHLVLLSKLVCEKKWMQRILAGLLLIAGIGYIVSNSAAWFVEDYELKRASVEAIFILPMILGEVGLAIWMLMKGGK
ncbi:MAG: DUF4386 family protein [Bacteroidetes bacterium]|nr:DUF4386 family protein [Bacteroidota bacterium]